MLDKRSNSNQHECKELINKHIHLMVAPVYKFTPICVRIQAKKQPFTNALAVKGGS